MNLQPLIDNAHLIVAAIALLFWVWFQIVKFKAERNPGTDWWDNQLERSKWALGMVTEAIDRSEEHTSELQSLADTP
jgi:hypothetical protein